MNDILASPDPDDPSLEELFLKADRIGRKYQTPEEIEAFEQALKTEVEAISAQVDQQFPEQEVEMMDYSPASRSRKKPPLTKSRKTKSRKK
ncbi:MAG: hypothetical protein EA342_14245 [Leptolyngbya sp. LCM1.Bin17]|nr:MAG: hypothetical protein EA342_14245 [Leptolyngbya sp. LCM1.Bin17]